MQMSGTSAAELQVMHCFEQLPPLAAHLPIVFASSQSQGLLEHTPPWQDSGVFHFPSENARGAIHLLPSVAVHLDLLFQSAPPVKPPQVSAHKTHMLSLGEKGRKDP